MSLRARIGLAAGVAVALAVLAVSVTVYAGTRSELRSQVDRALRNLSAPAESRADAGASGGDRAPGGGGPQRADGGRRLSSAQPADCDQQLGLDGGGPGFGGATGLRQFVSRTGQVCALSGGPKLPLDAHGRAVAAAGQGRYFTDLHLSGHHLRELVAGLRGRGAIQLALPLSDVDSTLSHEILLLAVIAAAGVALAALLGLVVARTALAPIARFTRRTETIAARSGSAQHERLEVSGNDELARLARTFNTTLDALEHSVQSQRNLVADASHELRTPIASLRANLQMLTEEGRLPAHERAALRADMIAELDELTGLVSDVVELARGASPAGPSGEVRLELLVQDVLARTRRRAPAMVIEASLEPTLVAGEADRIARAVSNLLDNAVKWSPPTGPIEVDLTAGKLTVRDHGPGFPPEDIPMVFERFHRSKQARAKPGSGLGLAIVRQTAESHGGWVRASNAPDGGARLEVSFGEPLELEGAPTEGEARPGVASPPLSEDRAPAGEPA